MALLGQLVLRDQLIALQRRIDDLALDRVNAAALPSLELRELLLALAILLLAAQFRGEELEAFRGTAPDRAQLKIRDALGGLLGPPEIALERRHLLLGALRRTFLEL